MCSWLNVLSYIPPLENKQGRVWILSRWSYFVMAAALCSEYYTAAVTPPSLHTARAGRHFPSLRGHDSFYSHIYIYWILWNESPVRVLLWFDNIKDPHSFNKENTCRLHQVLHLFFTCLWKQMIIKNVGQSGDE